MGGEFIFQYSKYSPEFVGAALSVWRNFGEGRFGKYGATGRVDSSQQPEQPFPLVCLEVGRLLRDSFFVYGHQNYASVQPVLWFGWFGI